MRMLSPCAQGNRRRPRSVRAVTGAWQRVNGEWAQPPRFFRQRQPDLWGCLQLHRLPGRWRAGVQGAGTVSMPSCERGAPGHPLHNPSTQITQRHSLDPESHIKGQGGTSWLTSPHLSLPPLQAAFTSPQFLAFSPVTAALSLMLCAWKPQLAKAALRLPELQPLPPSSLHPSAFSFPLSSSRSAP